MRCYVNAIQQARKRKSVRDQPGYVHSPAENQARGLLLEFHRGAVTATSFFSSMHILEASTGMTSSGTVCAKSRTLLPAGLVSGP